MRISDLLPKKPDAGVPSSPRAATLPSAPPPPSAAVKPAPQPAPPAPVRPSAPPPPVLSKEEIETRARSMAAYRALVRASRSVLNALRRRPPQLPDLELLCEAVESAREALDANVSSMLEYAERSTADDPRAAHLANVALLSTALARHLRLPAETQLAIGVGALIHDLAPVLHPDEFPPLLMASEEDETKVSLFVNEALQQAQPLFDSMRPDAAAIARNIIAQCQERASGQGLPAHLQGAQISREAQVVGICDVYEWLTHARGHGPRKLPADALKEMLAMSGDLFEGALVKSLMEMLTFFPPGTYVRLSSGELARVLSVNTAAPARPVVRLVAGADGKAASGARVDLASRTELSVERAADECAAQLADPKLALELRAQRWWLE